MINIKDKSKCSGCTACMNKCPKDAIYMQEDENGFKYPIVDMVSKPFNETSVKAIVDKMISIHNFN